MGVMPTSSIAAGASDAAVRAARDRRRAASAGAKIIELGQTAGDPPTPSCPGKPCLAVSRTTGYQAKVGTTRGLFVAPARGRVVAWSISLGAPTAKQIKFFNTTLGGAPSAGITIYKPGEHLHGTVLSQSPVMQLTPFLGETCSSRCERTLEIKKGSAVALTVPTWAPALAIGSARTPRGAPRAHEEAVRRHGHPDRGDDARHRRRASCASTRRRGSPIRSRW